MAKVLHIFNNETKFSKKFFEFLQYNNFKLHQHELFHYGNVDPSYKKFPMRIVFAKYYSGIKHLQLLSSMFKAEKIIIHSLASPWLLLFLYLFPKLTEKVYWVIWGKDLYFYKLLKKKQLHHKLYEFFRKRVFKNIKHVVTCVPGDAQLAKEWYEVNAECHECIMYPSNLFKKIDVTEQKHASINILLGNSADPSNNHINMLNQLQKHNHKDIKIYAPLSYGNMKYRSLVNKEGKRIFGKKFIPLNDFIDYHEYLILLGKIDIAVFGHERQQAMGNTITLLGIGKKIYMNTKTTSWELFDKLNIITFDNNRINLDRLKSNDRINNIERVQVYFSEKNYIKQLNNLFS